MIHIAAQLNILNSLEVLIKNGANINLKNNDGDTALNIALKFKNKKAAKIILNSNPDLSVKNNRQHNALYIAAQNQIDELLPFLAPNSNILNQSLRLAINNNCKDSLAILLDFGNKYCKKYQISDNLFSLAAKISNVKIMIILTSKITYTDKSGTCKETPLHVAVENNNYDIADILIKNGADIYKQDLFSVSPYDIAKSKGKNKLYQDSPIIQHS